MNENQYFDLLTKFPGKNFVFLDLETTALDVTTCEPIEMAYIPMVFYPETGESSRLACFNELYLPRNRADENNIIPLNIQGITNIWDEDVLEKEWFVDSNTRKSLQKLVADFPEIYAVSHNNEYDLPILERYGITFKNKICTLNFSKMLFPDLPDHKLNTVAAHLKVNRKSIEAKTSLHRADYDTLLCQRVFEKMMENISDDLDTLIKKSEEVAKIEKTKFPIGKNYGQIFDKNNHDHVGFYRWMKSKPDVAAKHQPFIDTIHSMYGI